MKNTNFICHLTPKKMLYELPSLSNAAYLFQNKVIKSIEPNNIISIMPLPCRGLPEINDNATNNITYLNGRNSKLTLFKLLFDYFDAIKLIQKQESNVYYSLNIQSFLLVFISKYFYKCKNYIIIADYEATSSYKKIHRKLIQYLINSTYSICDGVIVLNENIKVHANTKVFNALVDDADLNFGNFEIKKNSILFSGSIGKTTGIDIAIKAMDFLPDYKLCITGKMYDFDELSLLELVNQSKHKNIDYKGNIDYEEYQQLLEKVEYALSIRNPNDKQHSFNFPSKIVEYLSYNKKVISTISYPSVNDIIILANFDPASLSESIKKSSESPQPNTRKNVIDKFGLSKFFSSFQELIRDTKN